MIKLSVRRGPVFESRWAHTFFFSYFFLEKKNKHFERDISCLENSVDPDQQTSQKPWSRCGVVYNPLAL